MNVPAVTRSAVGAMSPRKRTDTRTCTHPGCEQPLYADGMCRSKYDRKRKYGDPHHPIHKGSKPRLPAELQHISRHKLNRWVNAGYLNAPKAHAYKRVWEASEVRVAVHMHRLVTELGMSPAKAAPAARELVAGRSLKQALGG